MRSVASVCLLPAALWLALWASLLSCQSTGELHAGHAGPASARDLPGHAAASEQRKVFLWRAQVGASTLHLLGSVHVARPDLYPLDARIDGAFTQSDVLVLELVLDEAAKLQAARRMLELGRLGPGVKLSDVIRPATWQLLEQTAERRGTSLFGLRGFRPWFVSLALTTQALESQGFSSDNGIDEHFRQRATGHKRLAALETVEEQLALFSGLSPEADELMLEQTLEEVDQYAEQLDAAFRAWQAGDEAALDQLLIGPMRAEYPALFKQLFVDRNQRMTAKLLAMMSEQPGRYFAVVGAGHLVGESGIVDLLRLQGIVATQL
jgi:uncharacterized protein YbaP (TraB family)